MLLEVMTTNRNCAWDYPILHVFHGCMFMYAISTLNTLRPRQNGRRFADDTFKRIFLNENVRISIKISLKFVPMGPIDNIPALVQIMAWRRPGDKPLSEPMMVSLPTHICVTRPQWVNKETHNQPLLGKVIDLNKKAYLPRMDKVFFTQV